MRGNYCGPRLSEATCRRDSELLCLEGEGESLGEEAGRLALSHADLHTVQHPNKNDYAQTHGHSRKEKSPWQHLQVVKIL